MQVSLETADYADALTPQELVDNPRLKTARTCLRVLPSNSPERSMLSGAADLGSFCPASAASVTGKSTRLNLWSPPKRLLKYLQALRPPLEFFNKPTGRLVLRGLEMFERAVNSGKVGHHSNGKTYAHGLMVEMRERPILPMLESSTTGTACRVVHCRVAREAISGEVVCGGQKPIVEPDCNDRQLGDKSVNIVSDHSPVMVGGTLGARFTQVAQ